LLVCYEGLMCLSLSTCVCVCADSQYLYLFPGSAEHIHDFTVLPTIAASLFAILYSVLWMP